MSGPSKGLNILDSCVLIGQKPGDGITDTGLASAACGLDSSIAQPREEKESRQAPTLQASVSTFPLNLPKPKCRHYLPFNTPSPESHPQPLYRTWPVGWKGIPDPAQGIREALNYLFTRAAEGKVRDTCLLSIVLTITELSKNKEQKHEEHSDREVTNQAVTIHITSYIENLKNPGTCRTAGCGMPEDHIHCISSLPPSLSSVWCMWWYTRLCTCMLRLGG